MDGLSEAQVAGLEALRAPFADAQLGKLPRVTCPDCSDRKKQCSRHTKKKCQVCGAYVSEQHIHLDFVGHADLTDRFLSVDPLWSWEPVAFGDDGLPATRIVGNMHELWIRLTVCGVTRYGVGTCETSKQEVSKELIGDALRNAGMRFGAALDLWSKSDRLESQDPDAQHIDFASDAQVAELTAEFDRVGDPELRRQLKQRFVGAFPGFPKAFPASRVGEARRWIAGELDGPAEAPEEPDSLDTHEADQRPVTITKARAIEYMPKAMEWDDFVEWLCLQANNLPVPDGRKREFSSWKSLQADPGATWAILERVPALMETGGVLADEEPFDG